MDIQTVFFNRDNRPRSGWRLTIFLFAFTFCFGLLYFAASALLSVFNVRLQVGSLAFIAVNSLISLISAILTGWLCGKFLEDLPFRALGCWFTKNWWKDLSAGLILGAFAIVSAILLGMIFGDFSFQLNRDAAAGSILLTLAISLVVFIVAGAFEEALFRGYILQTFARARLAWLAIVLTSLFFAFGHLGNPNANYISTLNTILAGIWFSLAYLKTRTLWLPIGLHLIWNWLQGAVFGIEVSGLKNLAAAPVFREIDRGPAWLTGADYGIEGGFACTIAIILSIGLLYFLPFLKPTEEMLALTSKEKKVNS
ncbi:MAG TPA: type II CAAX endopeptidase family protein [Pyrinomonadaceae bacterium]|jgi:membrane protease YdiL (CAAX protease family)